MAIAIIFDMDGVVSDTQKLHSFLESELLKKYGFIIEPEEVTEKYAGVPFRAMLEELSSKNNLKVDIGEIIKEKIDRLISSGKNNIPTIPVSIELISKLKKYGFKLGLASSSPLKFIELVLSELRLRETFDVFTGIEEVKKGKPDPELFLLTAKKLGIQPSKCIVIEDALNGMIAAKKAGMKCIGFVENKKSEKYPADLLVDSLDQITPEKIKCLLN